MLIYRFLGCGGVCPRSDRGLTSLYVQCNRTSVLIDCGEGTQAFATKYGIGLFNIDAILLTHLHADHILGLPGLIATMANSDRKKPLLVYGPPGTIEKVHSILGLLYATTFRVFAVEIAHGDAIEFSNFTVNVAALQHSVTCYGYSFVVNRPPAYDPAIVQNANLSETAVSLLQSGCDIEYNGMVLNINTVFGVDRDYVKLVYATDTGVCDNLVELCKDADVAILDGSYGDDTQRPKLDTSEIHMTFAEAANVAKGACVEELILTHFSPVLASPWVYLTNATDIFPKSSCAYGGLFGSLTYNKDTQNEHLPNIGISDRSLKGIIHRGYGFIRASKPIKMEGARCNLIAPHYAAIAIVSDVTYTRNGVFCSYSSDPNVNTSIYVELLQCTRYPNKEAIT